MASSANSCKYWSDWGIGLLVTALVYVPLTFADRTLPLGNESRGIPLVWLAAPLVGIVVAVIGASIGLRRMTFPGNRGEMPFGAFDCFFFSMFWGALFLPVFVLILLRARRGCYALRADATE